MRKVAFVLFFYFSVTSIYAQKIEFKDESGKHPMYDLELDKIINKQFTSSKDNPEFEFRFYILPSLVINGETVFVMHLNNSKWDACYFQKDNEGKWFGNDLIRDGVAELWDNLEKNKVLTLPDASEIRYLKKAFYSDTSAIFNDLDSYKVTSIVDGKGYHFELSKYRFMKRAYSYHCPKAYLQIYPNIEELYRAYVIILYIHKFLGLPLSDIG